MNIATSLLKLLKASAAFLVTAVGLLFSANDDDGDDRMLICRLHGGERRVVVYPAQPDRL